MTIEQLKKIKEKNHDVVTVRRLIAEEGAKLSENTDYRKQVLVCGGTGCTSSSSMLVIEALEKELKEKGLDDILVIKTGCFGLCALGPIMIVYPEGSFYSQVTAAEVPEIVAGHLVPGGEPVKNIFIRKQFMKMAPPFRFPKRHFIKNR